MKGRFHLTSGLGKAAKPQAIAAKMLGAVCVVVDANENTVKDAVKSGYVDKYSDSLDETLRMVEEAKKKLFAEAYPLGRLVRPEEIAYAALYLASDEATMLTGTSINVNAGIGI